MTDKKANVLMIVGLFVLIGMIGGLTVAFFNYTRTGSVNLLSTGDISFNSNYDTVTISNVFPISTADASTDTSNVAEVEINVTGSTTYTDGIEYLIKAVNINSNLRNIIGISVDAEDLGTKVSNENYFENREGASTSLVTTYQKLNDNGYIAAGFIKSGATGVDGTITLKAYINKDKIAITDTIENGAIVASGYDNGTTAAWINGRYTMTTSEWNNLNSNGISFKIKVEANEGIWVTPWMENVNTMGRFSSTILAHKAEITEIYFEQMTQSQIDTRYAAATVKDDIAIDGSVPCWLEGNKLYVASPNTIYMSTGNRLFDDLLVNYSSDISKIEFNNVDTKMVTDMSWMFDCLDHLTTLDLSNFDTSSVVTMEGMFSWCSGLLSIDVSSFNTSNVTNMDDMFDHCLTLSSLNVSNFNTNNVTSMSGMFNCCSGLTSIDVSHFNTSKVQSMAWMFCGCDALITLNLGNFNTSNVSGMLGMFEDCSSLTSLNLSSFNTANVTLMTRMFNGCSSLETITFGNNFTTGNVQGMWMMFRNCTSLTELDLSTFNISRVTQLDQMFQNDTALTKIEASSDWSNSSASSSNMFDNCESLVGGANTHYDASYKDKTYARIDNPTNSQPGYFTYKAA